MGSFIKVVSGKYGGKEGFHLFCNGEYIAMFYGGNSSLGREGFAKVDGLMSFMSMIEQSQDGVTVEKPEIINCDNCGSFHDIPEKFHSEIIEYKNGCLHIKDWCPLCVRVHLKKIKERISKGLSPYPMKSKKRSKNRSPRKNIKSKDRLYVLQRDKSTCQMCGSKAPDVTIHIDHILPVSKGGLNNIDNLQCLCAECNQSKSNKIDLHINKTKEKTVS